MNSYPGQNETYSVPPQAPPRPESVRVKLPNVPPYASYVILGVTVLVYVLQYLSTQVFGFDLLLGLGVKANDYIVQGQLWRLITPVFLHGSIYHIGFNMYALYIMGPGIERIWGHTRFLALYFLAGFAGNVLSFALTASPSLGASTAVFGLLAAQGVFIYRNQKLFAGRTRGALSQIVFVAIINLALGLTPGSIIDNWGHIGGLLGGLVFSWMAAPLMTVGGMAPEYTLEDHREAREIWLGAVLVLLIFGAIAGVLILTRLG